MTSARKTMWSIVRFVRTTLQTAQISQSVRLASRRHALLGRIPAPSRTAARPFVVATLRRAEQHELLALKSTRNRERMRIPKRPVRRKRIPFPAQALAQTVRCQPCNGHVRPLFRLTLTLGGSLRMQNGLLTCTLAGCLPMSVVVATTEQLQRCTPGRRRWVGSEPRRLRSSRRSARPSRCW